MRNGKLIEYICVTPNRLNLLYNKKLFRPYDLLFNTVNLNTIHGHLSFNFKILLFLVVN